MTQNIIADVLWFLILVGWIVLIIIGIEADKPLSGGIPGHVDPNAEHHIETEGLAGKLGTLGAWVVLGVAALSLPIILWWIFTVHPV